MRPKNLENISSFEEATSDLWGKIQYKQIFDKIYAAQRKSPFKNIQLCNILPRNYLLYIFEFQLAPFPFSLILGDLFMVKEWNFFQKNDFHVEKNFVGKMYREIVLHGGTNDQIVLRGKEFHKIYFLVI